VFVHYPLSQHRFAMAAARAVECAEAEGHFADLVAAIYEKQDSLGLRSWGSYAKEAGIADTTRIVKCASSSSRVSRIEQGIAYGNRLGVQFTPTIVVNGWRLGGTPSKTELIRIIEAIAGGHAPFDTAMKAGG
jgi:protein-disulfide isomerase